MKILHAVGWFFPDSVGGTEVYVAALARHMMSAGNEIAVIAPQIGIPSRVSYIHENVSVHRYPIAASLSRRAAQGREVVPGANAFDDIVREQQPDVVHFHTFLSGMGVREVRAAKATGAVVVATNHLPSTGYVCQRGTLMRWGESQCDGICRIIKCASCELQRKGLSKNAARSVAVAGLAFRHTELVLPEGRISTALLMPDLIEHNQKLQAELLELLDRFVFLNRRGLDIGVANGADPRKTSLSYLGTSHKRSRKPRPEEKPTTRPIRIGYLGRLAEVKGITDIARAVRSLPRDVEIVVEVRGPTSGQESAIIVEEVTRILGDDDRLTIAPAVSVSEVPDALARFDVLCVPSNWFENGPTVLLEAHAVGTPVIGTTAGAMPELIRPGIDGELIEPGDWKALARLFRAMADDPAGTIDHWRKNIPAVRTMDEISDEYLAMYEDLLASRRRT